MTTKEIITHTKRLMRIASTADNLPALQQAVDYMATLVARCPEVTIERFEQNGMPSFLAYHGTTRPKKFAILLNAHVDVVPAPKRLFTPVEKDGRLYGRGALDMKGTAMVLTDLFCEHVNTAPYSLGLQIVCDEEVGGYDGVCVQLKKGVRANFVVMGEYANHPHTIYNAARGLCWAEIAFSGKSAHGGHLWHGSNAVLKAGTFAAAVLKRYPTPDKETWTTTASIASLSTPNETFNKVPDSAVLKIDFRFTQEDPTFVNRESLESFIANIDPEAKLVRTATFEPAVHVPESNPYVQGMAKAMRTVTGSKPKFLGRPAASDGRHFGLVQTDIVEYGLYGQGSHSDNEYAELASFDEYRAVMGAFLQEPIPVKLKTASADKQPTTAVKTDYVWYATYGSGLVHDNFLIAIRGGTPEGARHKFPGCRDKSLPLQDHFISLPHRLFFSGMSRSWQGGIGALDTRRDVSSPTIARAYLITREQFEDLAAQENWQSATQTLPYDQATQRGSAIIAFDSTGYTPYDVLLYCGRRDGYPIFSLTRNRRDQAYTPPSEGYMRCILKGLSEGADAAPVSVDTYTTIS